MRVGLCVNLDFEVQNFDIRETIKLVIGLTARLCDPIRLALRAGIILHIRFEDLVSTSQSIFPTLQ